ncbi:ABC transporter permease [Rathayibacter rathayi]|uniref:ABC transporter permease n=1 Tax=Rathayibacter rathayi TaxID=33887 RepID=A0ABX5A805_RATRA|nr:ABC transporter permease [Rathayibacter rathayi]AZZ49424.1 ABC transporter permease [Rathayibacter rathayi]MWV73530.1 ABC transporter permease [Rathayibacter rathayi NCPPB 2980 = VKM Ac-1601]PPF23310.1 ABC transporter permease [Rathayibacter rathayi]PPF48497.1 ABC transporter permease [Rathayibacter rathayi]PPF75266.1 ABC transporter permease [Rathayibacter rathayi]
MTSFAVVAACVRIEILRFWREPIALFFTLIFPIVLIVIFGGSFGSHQDPSTGTSYYNSLVAIDATFLIGNFTLMGVTNDLANQKEAGITDASSLFPLKAWQRFVIESSAYLLIVFAAVSLVTVYVFVTYRDVEFRGNIGHFALVLAVAYFAFVSIAKLIASLAFSARTLQLIGSTVFFVLLFTSGVVIPRESLPDAVSWFTTISPMYLTYTSLEGIWNNTIDWGVHLLQMAELVAIVVVFTLLARLRSRVRG